MKRRDLLRSFLAGLAALPFVPFDVGAQEAEEEAPKSGAEVLAMAREHHRVRDLIDCGTCDDRGLVPLERRVDGAPGPVHEVLGLPCPECRHQEAREALFSVGIDPSDLPPRLFKAWLRGAWKQPSPLLELYESHGRHLKVHRSLLEARDGS